MNPRILSRHLLMYFFIMLRALIAVLILVIIIGGVVGGVYYYNKVRNNVEVIPSEKSLTSINTESPRGRLVTGVIIIGHYSDRSVPENDILVLERYDINGRDINEYNEYNKSFETSQYLIVHMAREGILLTLLPGNKLELYCLAKPTPVGNIYQFCELSSFLKE